MNIFKYDWLNSLKKRCPIIKQTKKVMPKFQTVDVFGLSRGVPNNYVERDAVDSEFRKALKLNRHIVIYGGSKQGKSSLIKHCLANEEYISIHCDNTMDRSDINANILKRAGFRIETSKKKSISGRNKLLVSINLEFIESGFEIDKNNEEEITSTSLELDIDDVNNVAAALKKIEFTKYIILEDFHYLPYETQRDFCISLKAFHEQSTLIFIVVGVWLEENRLIYYNGDLTGRVVSINVDKWGSDELKEVIETGANTLNISFSTEFTKRLIQNSFHSVFIVQEVCRDVCLNENILEKQDVSKVIGETINTEKIITELVNQQVSRYANLLKSLTTKPKPKPSQLMFYQWIIYSVINSPIANLELGLPATDICSHIPVDRRPPGTSNIMRECLRTLAYVQMELNIHPIIFDYEPNAERLKVVDKSYLIWLNAQDRNFLITEAGLENLRNRIF